jgi:hypothetical protein
MLPKYISLNNVCQDELGQGIGMEVNATMVLHNHPINLKVCLPKGGKVRSKWKTQHQI